MEMSAFCVETAERDQRALFWVRANSDSDFDRV